MIIRRAKSSDALALYKLEKELFLTKNFPLSKRAFTYHIHNNLLYIAEIDGNIVGYILVLIKCSNAKLYSVGVSSSYRSRGVAKKLLDSAVDILSDLGFKCLILEVRVDNEVAISLYKERGFSFIKDLKSFYLDGCDAYLMKLDIK